MKKCLASFLCVLFFFLPSFALAAFHSDYEAINSAAQSVLRLEVYGRHNTLLGTGSGFVAFDGQTLVTNAHVMEGALYALAYTDDSKECFRVENVLVYDEEADIAILRFSKPTGLTPLPLPREDDTLLRGEPVVAIGSPQGITNTVSIGNISLLYQENGISYIQFTAPISSGSSGGALLDDDGCVIGITTAAYVDDDDNFVQNLNLAVHISEVAARYEKAAAQTPADDAFPLLVPEDAQGKWEYIAGDLLRFRAEVRNVGDRPVTGFTLYCYTEDRDEERLIGATQVYQNVSRVSVAPGESAFSEAFVLEDAEKIAYVCVAVYSVEYADGAEEINPEPTYVYWALDE